MVANSDYVIAVWNGKPSGTGNTVKYAMKNNKVVLLVNPQTLEIEKCQDQIIFNLFQQNLECRTAVGLLPTAVLC